MPKSFDVANSKPYILMLQRKKYRALAADLSKKMFGSLGPI